MDETYTGCVEFGARRSQVHRHVSELRHRLGRPSNTLAKIEFLVRRCTDMSENLDLVLPVYDTVVKLFEEEEQMISKV